MLDITSRTQVYPIKFANELSWPTLVVRTMHSAPNSRLDKKCQAMDVPRSGSGRARWSLASDRSSCRRRGDDGRTASIDGRGCLALRVIVKLDNG
jgi:hypothetical protein